MKHRLFPLDELEPGSMRAIDVDGLQLVVVRTEDGGVHALRNRCSHLGARLSAGALRPMLVADDVGLMELSDRSVIRCPWHGFEFDVETGRCPADPVYQRVRVYPVIVEDGYVTVSGR